MMIELTDLGEDDNGPFARVSIQLGDSQQTVRWGLDVYTYLSLKSALSEVRRHQSAANVESRTDTLITLSPEYAWQPSHERFISHVSELAHGEVVHRTAFACSDLYASNLEWLKHVADVDELAAANEFELALADAPTVMVPRVWAPRTVAPPQKRRSFGPIGLRVLIGVVGVVGAVVGIRVWHEQRIVSPVAVGRAPTYHHAKAPTARRQAKLSRTHLTGKTMAKSADVKRTTPRRSTLASIVSAVPSGDVAITFSGGPSPYTLQILKILNEHHVHATFFFVGDRIGHWSKSVLAVARAADEIGDNSMTRPFMPALSATQQEQQIVHGKRAIQMLLHKRVPLFQPPYEAYNRTTARLVAQDHMAIALWNQDPRDWAAGSPSVIAKRVSDSAASGGVYIFDELPNTVKALPTIIRDLQQQNLKFVEIPHISPHPER